MHLTYLGPVSCFSPSLNPPGLAVRAATVVACLLMQQVSFSLSRPPLRVTQHSRHLALNCGDTEQAASPACMELPSSTFSPHNLMKWVLSLMSFSRRESRSTEILSKFPRVSQNDTGKDSCRKIIYWQGRRGCFLPSCLKAWTILTCRPTSRQRAYLIVCRFGLWISLMWLLSYASFCVFVDFRGHFN